MGQLLELNCQPTDLTELVTRAVAESQATTEQQHLQLEAVPTLVGEWDTARLERVVANLLDNAVKYSGDAKQIIVNLTRDDAGAEPLAVLTVQDFGIGIPAEDLPRIFERFHRGSNVGGVATGSGLGLAGARQIVGQHGGTLTVASQVGQGSTFTVRLPLTSPSPG
jgi:signal transduction histidine kinase